MPYQPNIVRPENLEEFALNVEDELRAIADAVASLEEEASEEESLTQQTEASIEKSWHFEQGLSLGVPGNTPFSAVRADRELIAGYGLEGGGDLTEDLRFDLEETGVEAGSYGGLNQLLKVEVDEFGRLTSIKTESISMPEAQLPPGVMREDRAATVTALHRYESTPVFNSPEAKLRIQGFGSFKTDILYGSGSLSFRMWDSSVEDSVSRFVFNPLEGGFYKGDRWVVEPELLAHTEDGTIHFTQEEINIPLGQASDVGISNPLNRQGLLFNTSTNLWENRLLVEADISDLKNYEEKVNKGQANGYAPLNSDAKVPEQYIPAVAITETHVVADIAARDAMSPDQGDVAIVEDASADVNVDSGSASYIYDGAEWRKLKTPDDLVHSVNGQTGDVILDLADVGTFGTGLSLASNELSFDTTWGDNRYTLQSAFDSHTGDLDIHRPLNDTQTTTTNLWSADKIQSEINAIDEGSAIWGNITGTLSNQTDLQNALDGKSNTGHTHTLSDITDSGTAAGRNIGTSNGNVMEQTSSGFGGFGYGVTQGPVIGDFFDISDKEHGFYRFDSNTTNSPGFAGPAIALHRASTTGIWLAADVSGGIGSNALRLYGVSTSGNSNDFGTWQEFYHTGNLNPLEDSDLAANGGTIPQVNLGEIITGTWSVEGSTFPNFEIVSTEPDGKRYGLYSTGSGTFMVRDKTAGSNRFRIDTNGAARFGDADSMGSNGSVNAEELYENGNRVATRNWVQDQDYLSESDISRSDWDTAYDRSPTGLSLSGETLTLTRHGVSNLTADLSSLGGSVDESADYDWTGNHTWSNHVDFGGYAYFDTLRGPRWRNGNDTTNADLADFPEVSTAAVRCRLFRGTNTTGNRDISIYKGDGTNDRTIILDAASGNVEAESITVGATLSRMIISTVSVGAFTASANAITRRNVSVSGAQLGDQVSVTDPSGNSVRNDLLSHGYVSSSGTVTIAYTNPAGSGVNLSGHDVNVVIKRH